MYDILDVKLRMFSDKCHKAAVPTAQYADALSTMLNGRALDYYYEALSNKGYSYNEMIAKLRIHFETEQNQFAYLAEWNNLSLRSTFQDNPDKDKLECLQIMLSKAIKVRNALGTEYQTERTLRDKIVTACMGVAECNNALMNPANDYESLCAQLRSSISITAKVQNAQQFYTYQGDDNDDKYEQSLPYYEHNWVDRTYNKRGGFRGRGRQSSRPWSSTKYQSSLSSLGSRYQKKCYVCKRPGCWSTKHTPEERQEAFERFSQHARYKGRRATEQFYQTFLNEVEGQENQENPINNDLSDDQKEIFDQLATEPLMFTIPREETANCTESFIFSTEYANINGKEVVSVLQDRSTYHAFTSHDPYEDRPIKETPVKDNEVATFLSERYSDENFYGIMPDTGAAGVSSAGMPQCTALQRLFPSIKIDESKAGQYRIKFGLGTGDSLGTVTVDTPVGKIVFHTIPANTPFLMCISDMDKLGVYLNNLTNVLVQGSNNVPVVRKFGHPWMLLQQKERIISWNHLTEAELRQLHRRFGHPSIDRLGKVIRLAGHDVSYQAMEKITKHCHQCQLHGKAPGRFKFTLQDDYNFNYKVIVDMMWIDEKIVLHVVDEATSFQAARFLKSRSAKDAWEALQECWIDTYQGPPDYIVTDAGTNFASEEFRNRAKVMTVQVEEVPVEAHNSIGKIERYHGPLRRAFRVIQDELGESTSKENILQMAVKAINDTAGPDGLVPTLLVFGAYPRLVDTSPPSPSVAQRAQAIKKAMQEVRKMHAERKVNDALGMRNGPNTERTLNLPLQSNVVVYREKYKKWTGPFKLIGMDGETCTIQMRHGPVKFRSNVVKPYFEPRPTNDNAEEQQSQTTSSNEETPSAEEAEELPRTEDPMPVEEVQPSFSPDEPSDTIVVQKDKPDEYDEDTIVVQARSNNFVANISYAFHSETDVDNKEIWTVFITSKEQSDHDLAIQLRKEGKISTSGEPFETSDRLEIENLTNRGVFSFEKYNPVKFQGVRIFKSRLVREVKGKSTDTPYEKSRLVIQGYDDDGKEMILTQSPTIQRASQRIIMALAPSLIKDYNMTLSLRDISQAYTQSTTKLNRMIIARLPKEMEHLYPHDTVMLVVKPLYGIAEAGTHWWATYSKHHRENLAMTTSTYDPCLLVTISKDKFGIVGMQTDDTIILSNTAFSELEEHELQKAKFLAKPKEIMSLDTPLIFNGCILTKRDETILMTQKGQGKGIVLIEADDTEAKQRYVEQRARGAYLASICQPEATFDLSKAAQHQDPTREDINALNKRLLWQQDNIDRGLAYINVDLATAKLFVFVDGSFANNKDLSSQIGFVIILANETTSGQGFTINGSLIHWSSTKSKRVTRSVLASEIYAMVAGVDMALVINSTLNMIIAQLDLPKVSTIICTDSYSLYECLVKLGTTKEKRLMIDIMALRQSYERREILEVRWISGQDNPADAMTKINPNKALEKFVDTNKLSIRMKGWVKRD